MTYADKATNKTKYSLWVGSHVYTADSAAGPWKVVTGFSYSGATGRPGQNPAPMFHDGESMDREREQIREHLRTFAPSTAATCGNGHSGDAGSVCTFFFNRRGNGFVFLGGVARVGLVN